MRQGLWLTACSRSDFGIGQGKTLARATVARGCVALALGLGAIGPVVAEDWPQFLGPNRDGTSAETGLADAWGDEGPKELWRVPGGVGMAGIAVRERLVVTTAQDDREQFAIALDLTDGTTRWRTAIGPAYENQMGDGPRATPAIDGDRVYVQTGDGKLIALSSDDGRELWRRDVIQATDGKEADYGMAASPLVIGDRVIVTAGGPSGTVVACDAASGDVVWKAGDDRAGYSSPVLRKVGSGGSATEQVIVFSAGMVSGIDPATGEVAWSFPFETPYDCNIAAPIALDGDLLISAGENHGSVRLALTFAGDRWQAEAVWESLGPRAVLRSEWQTPLLVDGLLFGFDNVGSAGPVTHLTCIDPATGKSRWREERFGKGNAIAADGKLFATTMDGDVVLIDASGEAFRELGRARVHGGTRQAPSLANGILLIRDDAEIIALDVRR